MTKIYFATNRKNDDPTHVGGFGANIVGLDESAITYASVEVDRTDLADENSGVLGPILNATPGMFADADLQEIIGSGKNLLVFLHGFANSFEDAIKRAAFNADWFKATQVPAADTTVIAFTWPSLGELFAAPPHLLPHNYFTDRTQAGKSGFHIYHFLRRIEEIRGELSGRLVYLLAHSMGNFALQAAVQWWLTSGEPADIIFDEAILAAADEQADTFETPADGRLSALPRLTKRITIYYSINDIAMHFSTALNLRARLGFNGPENKTDERIYPPTTPKPPRPPARFRMVGCSEVRDYSWIDPPDATHQYYRRSPKVQMDIASVMADNAQPSGGIIELTTPGIDDSDIGRRIFAARGGSGPAGAG